MGNRIAILLVLIAALIGGYFVYKHHQEDKMEAGGEFTCTGCMTPEEKAKFDKEDHGETSDGQSERKTRTARADDAAGFPEANKSATEPAVVTATTTPTTTATTTIVATATPVTPTNQVMPPVAPVQPVAGNPGGSAVMPITDTLMPNAPNGMAFGGKGTYQWYRQGSLTWRLDTVSGRSCIVYATMEEWRKQIVLSHGCGRDA